MPLLVANRRRGVVIATTLVVLTLVLAVVWDWTWFRPLLQHYVRERSGRELSFDKLHVGLDAGLSPRIAFDGLRVQNAPWAGRQVPLISAHEIAFTFTWASLFEDKLVVSRLRLVDADVDMERQADGLRNWRLTRPDDKGPGRIKVLTLDAVRSRIHVIHAGIALDLDAASTPLAFVQTLPRHPDLPLEASIAFSGTLAGTRFDGTALAGQVLSFVDSGKPFGLRGSVRAGGAELLAEGSVTDMIALRHLDVDLRAKRGRSDAAGRVDVRRDPGDDARTAVHASLTSERVDLHDLSGRSSDAQASQALMQRLRSFDADIDWHIARLDVSAPIPPVQNARLQARLAQGVLTADRIVLSLARGTLNVRGRLDASAEQPSVTLAASAIGLHVDDFAGPSRQASALGGELDAQLAWQARGPSWRSWLRSGSGTLAASLAHGSMPASLDAKLALDAPGVVAAFFRRGARVPVHCSSLHIEFKNGKGTTRELHVDTDRVAVAGRGAVDLGDERFEVVLTPRLHRSALFALERSVQVKGRFDDPVVTLVERDDSAPTTTCAPRG